MKKLSALTTLAWWAVLYFTLGYLVLSTEGKKPKSIQYSGEKYARVANKHIAGGKLP